MKILMISTDRKIFEENSAVRQRIIEYGNLVEELHIIIFNTNKYEKIKILNSNISLYPTNSKNKIINIPDTNVWLYSTNSRSKLLYIFDAIKLAKNILKSRDEKIKNNKEDWLITTQDPFETGLAGWFIAKILKVKLQLQVHTDFLSEFFKKDSFLNRIRVVIALFLLPRADGIRVVSERIKKAILASLKLPSENKITVLPIFIDLERIQNTESTFNLRQKYPQFNFIFLVASRLEKEKNVDLIIKSFSEVIRKHPKAGLVIIGNGSFLKNLQLTVNSLQLKNNILFEGWQNDLIGYYKNSDLFLSASSYEGFGITLVEASMSGCPILTTRVGIVGEILSENNSLICDVSDRDCFAHKMVYAIENKEILREMNKKAQLAIEENLIVDKQEYLEGYVDGWKMVK